MVHSLRHLQTQSQPADDSVNKVSPLNGMTMSHLLPSRRHPLSLPAYDVRKQQSESIIGYCGYTLATGSWSDHGRSWSLTMVDHEMTINRPWSDHGRPCL